MITTIINIIIFTVVIFITIKINIIIIIYHQNCRTRRLKSAAAPHACIWCEHVINLSQLKTIILMLNYSTTFNQINNNNKKKSKDPNTLDFYELDPFDLRVNV